MAHVAYSRLEHLIPTSIFESEWSVDIYHLSVAYLKVMLHPLCGGLEILESYALAYIDIALGIES